MSQQNNINTAPLFWRNSLAGKFISVTVVIVFILMGIYAYVNFQSQQAATIDNLKKFRGEHRTAGTTFVRLCFPERIYAGDWRW